MAAKIDEVGYGVLAEELGFARIWVADSPMILSDCYATMALIARETAEGHRRAVAYDWRR